MKSPALVKSGPPSNVFGAMAHPRHPFGAGGPPPGGSESHGTHL